MSHLRKFFGGHRVEHHDNPGLTKVIKTDPPLVSVIERYINQNTEIFSVNARNLFA
jgi:hypothetical protein